MSLALPFAVLFLSAAAPPPERPLLLSATRQMTHEGKWDPAAEALNAAIDRAAGAHDARLEAMLAAELLRVVSDRSAYHRRDPESVRRALARAEAAARRAADPRADADLAQYVGQVRYGEAFSTGDWESPRALFRTALEGRDRLGDRRGAAESLFYLGLTFEQAGQPEPAMEQYARSRAIAEEIGDAALQSYTERHIGAILEQQGRLDAAYDHVARSVALRREARFFVTLPFALMQQADFLVQHRADRARAMQLLDEAIDVADRYGSTRALSAARLELARLSAEEQPREALSIARCGLDAARRFGDREEVEEAEKQISAIRSRLSS
jgi:tetratricopeptide (TPR) repeat protein